MADTLVARYTGGVDPNSIAGPFLYLVQDDITSMSAAPTADDLEAILNFIISGRSARSYNAGNCPMSFAGNRVYLHLDFFVHTSSEETQYSLTPTVLSEISDAVEEENEDDQHVIVGMTDYIDLERNITNVLHFQFLTSCYNELGILIPTPEYRVVGSRIVFDQKFFAVVRVHYLYIAYRHTISIIAEYDETTQATDPQTGELKTIGELAGEGVYGYMHIDWTCSITATYIDEDGQEGTKTLSLKIPSCVDNMVGTCIYPPGTGGVSVEINPPKDDSAKIVVYYDNCDGTFLRADFP